MSGRSQIYGTAIETDNLTAETQADTRTGNTLGRIERHKYLLPAGFTYRLPVIGNIDDSTLPFVYRRGYVNVRSPGLDGILDKIIHHLRYLSIILSLIHI